MGMLIWVHVDLVLVDDVDDDWENGVVVGEVGGVVLEVGG